MFDDLLGRSSAQSDGKADIRRIQGWARALWKLDPDVKIMVSELRCHEDGCPDVETVIAVLEAGATHRIKIPKPMETLAKTDLPEALI